MQCVCFVKKVGQIRFLSCFVS